MTFWSLCSLQPVYYRRPLSVAWAKSIIFCQCFFIFYSRLILRPWLTEVRESFTRCGPWVSLEKLLLGFFPGHLQLHGRPKSDEIWRIFRPHPQTFCSHARTRQNIVILKKNLLSTDDCSTRNATFGHLWPTNPWDPRATKFFKKWHAWIACDMSYFRSLHASTTTTKHRTIR